MQVTRSGYYAFRDKKIDSLQRNNDLLLEVEVKAIHKLSHASYGSRRISKALKAKGYNVGRYQARTLMRKAKIECKQRRRFRVTTNSKHNLPMAENILDRKFEVSEPNRVWVADITYLWTQEGWLYLAAVIDLFSRRVVGWSLAEHMREELATDALSMAIQNRRPGKGILQHTDRGIQYACATYQKYLHDTGFIVSMSRKGNCWDNAVMERFFGSLKTERTDGKIYFTRAEAKADVISYIEEFYNKVRLHSALTYVSPMEYEEINYPLFDKVS
jgi:transposase InsO family protein